MQMNILDIIEFKKWNRKILNSLWLIIIVCLVAEIAIFLGVAVKRGNGNFTY